MKLISVAIVLFCIIASDCLSEEKINTDSLFSLQKSQTGPERVWTLLELGTELSNSNPDSAIVLYNIGIIEAQNNKYTLGIVDCFVKIASALNIKNDYNQVIDYCNLALKTLGNKNEKKKSADIFCNLGVAYENLGQFDSAIVYDNKSNYLYNSIGYKKGIMDSQINIGNSFLHLGEYTTALDYFLKVQQKIEGDQNNIIYLSRIYHNISNVYSKLGLHVESLDNLYKSYTIEKKLNFQGFLCETMINIADTYLKMKDFSRAKLIIDTAFILAKKINDPYLISILYLNLGSVNFEEGDLSKAERLYNVAYSISDSLKDDLGIALSQKNLAQLYAKRGEFSNSLNLLREALTYFISMKMLDEIKESYLIKSEIYKLKGDNKKALESYSNYMNFSDSIRMKDSKYLASVAILKSNSEREIEKLKQQNELSESNSIILKYIILSLVTVIISIILLIVVNLRKNRVIKKTKNDVYLRDERIDKLHEKILENVSKSLTTVSAYIYLKKDEDDIKYLESSFNTISNFVTESISLIRTRF
ncbi:MAG: tetratricopeptide repeat protein [Candidatus Kapabacteria bacterium]|nr:tetratricopeptide repeat protein [Candidatus Kapabacteria bacterium]